MAGNNKRIDTYVGNNYGFGGNKFDGKFNMNLHDGLSAPSGSNPAPPNPPIPPPDTNIDTYVGNNYGFGGNKFDGNYEINIGGGGKKNPNNNDDDHKKTKPYISDPQPQHTAGRSTYTKPSGGMDTSCPVCGKIWASNHSMSNYQTLLRGDHIYG